MKSGITKEMSFVIFMIFAEWEQNKRDCPNRSLNEGCLAGSALSQSGSGSGVGRRAQRSWDLVGSCWSVDDTQQLVDLIWAKSGYRSGRGWLLSDWKAMRSEEGVTTTTHVMPFFCVPYIAIAFYHLRN